MAPSTLAPLTSRFAQRMPGARPLQAYAVESAVVCDAEVEPMRRAVYPDAELELITGVHEFSAGLEDELHLATRDHVRHSETIAWRLRDVYVSPGILCNYRSYKRLTHRQLRLAPAAINEIEDTVAFCSTDAGNDYFAHFLLDDACTALLGEEFGRVVFGGIDSERTPHARHYLQAFSIANNEVAAARFRDLWFFTDYPQNSHRRARLQSLRSRLTERYGDKPATAPVYLKRGSSGQLRLLENEPELEALLSARGFDIIDPERLSVAEICSRINGAPLVVGVEGSQLAHGVLNLRAGGSLLCIQPAARFNA
ncbi:MAG: glycosyltransferase family 61 protein, partial [Gammaproteobacteria bacterium]|nr:glycosyltransferase family 61 protein [Gammaproteobacteria bacterium]